MDAAGQPDEILVQATMAGDLDAFASLYRRHAGAVRHVIQAVVHDHETAADLTQDAFARAIEALGDLRSPERFRPWLLSIARHRAVDHVRARPRWPPQPLDDTAEEAADQAPEPAELAELAGLAERLRGCVSGLSPRDATVLALVTQLGYSPAEVAGALGISPGAAKVVLHRARRRLRRALALALLAEQGEAACPAFREAYRNGQLSLAGAHVTDCPVCRATVNAEVHLYTR